MKAEIISCGTEMLLGDITDTNATFLAQELANLGSIFYVSQVSTTSAGDLAQASLDRSDLISPPASVRRDDLTRGQSPPAGRGMVVGRLSQHLDLLALTQPGDARAQSQAGDVDPVGDPVAQPARHRAGLDGRA
jgi:hypothetical protein